MFFITGPNGVGKSTLIPHLVASLSATDYDVRDFDVRGVPENAGTAWRLTETMHWIQEGRATSARGRRLVVCGFVKINDFADMKMFLGNEIRIIHLDVSPEELRRRLEKRYSKDGVYDPSQTVIGKPVEVFIAGNLFIRESLRKEYEGADMSIVDTTSMTPEEVAVSVVALIKRVD